MYLALILGILGVVAVAECTPDGAKTYAFGAALLGLVVVCAALTAATRQTASYISAGVEHCSTREEWRTWMRRARWLERVAVFSWLIAAPLATALFAWTPIVRQFLPANAYGLDEILILCPSLVALVGVWSGISRVDAAVRRRCDLSADASPSEWQVLGNYARHHLGIVLPPVLVVFVLEDVAAQWQLGPWRWAVYLGVLFVIAALLPALMRILWKTKPLPPGPLKNRLRASGEAIGVPVRRMLIWETGGDVVNAAVAGLLPQLRYVLLSDGLLRQFQDDEIESVFRHEAAHVSRRHLVWRLLVVTLPVWLAAGLTLAAPEAWSATPPTLLLLVLPVAAIGYAVVGLSQFSRLLEHDADLEACRDNVDGACAVKVAAYLRMLDRLAGFSADRRTWLHPSLSDRRSVLIAAVDPQAFSLHRRKVDRVVALIVSCYVAAVLFFMYTALA